MEHNVELVNLAETLVPLLGYLYQKGITAFHGYDNEVHVSRKFFKETFPVYETEECETCTYFRYKHNGVTFFSMELKGVTEK